MWKSLSFLTGAYDWSVAEVRHLVSILERATAAEDPMELRVARVPVQNSSTPGFPAQRNGSTR